MMTVLRSKVQLAEGLLPVLVELPRIWELGVRRMPSNDCITFFQVFAQG